MSTLTIPLLSDDELARLEAYRASRQAEHATSHHERGWTPGAITLGDAAYFLLMQALMSWEQQQAPRE
jgi:hypothetical protein